MDVALHTVAETSGFLRDAKAAGVTDAERELIVAAISSDPPGGEGVVESGGVRKVRIAGRGKGKSGGDRIMVAYLGTGCPAYVLALLSKGERGNFSDAEIGAFRAATKLIRAHWKARAERGKRRR